MDAGRGTYLDGKVSKESSTGEESPSLGLQEKIVWNNGSEVLSEEKDGHHTKFTRMTGRSAAATYETFFLAQIQSSSPNFPEHLKISAEEFVGIY
jgi:hypothetical protein